MVELIFSGCKIIMTPFKLAVAEFYSLTTDNIITVEKAEWWVLKHSELHKEYKWELPWMEAIENEDNSGVTVFMRIFESIERYSEIHRKESVFKEKLLEYYKITEDKALVSESLKTHKELFKEYYLDIEREQDIELLLEIYVDQDKSFFFPADQFKYALKFIQVLWDEPEMWDENEF